MNNNKIFFSESSYMNTKKLVDLYIDLLKNKYISPSNILFLSVNEKKFLNLVLPDILKHSGAGFEDIWIDNYFSFCRKILRKHFREAKISKNFEVISGFEQRLLIRKILENRFYTKSNEEVIEKIKESDNFVREIINILDLMKAKGASSSKIYINQNFVTEKIYLEYQENLKQKNLFDYRDLVIKTIELFKDNLNILKKYQNKFKYLFLDDLEEISGLEFELIMLLGQEKNEKKAAVNKEACIYRFRGAYPEKYLDKLIDELSLEKQIIIGENKLQKISNIVKFINEEDEIYWIGRKIRKMIIDKYCSFRDIVIVRRSLKNSANIYRDIFGNANLDIPFCLAGMGGVFDNPTIINIMAYLKILYTFYHKKKLEKHQKLFEFDVNLDIFIRALCLGMKDCFEVKNDFIKINLGIDDFYETFKSMHKEIIAGNEVTFSSKTVEVIENFFFIFQSFEKVVNIEVTKLLELIYEKYNLFSLNNKNLNEINIFHKVMLDFSIIFTRLYERKFDLNEFIYCLDDILEAYTFEASVKDECENVVKIITIQQLKWLPDNKKVVFFAGCSEGIIPKIYTESKFFSKFELESIDIMSIKNYDQFMDEEKKLFNLVLFRSKEEFFISYSENTVDKNNLKLSSFVYDVFNKDENLDKKITTNDYTEKYESDFDVMKAQTKKEIEYFFTFNRNNDIDIDAKRRLISSSPESKFNKIFKNFEYSASAIEDYKKCNYLFLLSRVLRLKVDEDNIFFEFGNIAHEVLYEFHKIHRDYTSILSLPAAKDMQKIIDEIFEKKKYVFQGLGEMRWYKSRLEKIMEDYLIDLAKQETWQIIELEKKISIRINETNLKGRIDRIDSINKGLEVIDYKTSDSKWTSKGKLIEKIKEGDDIQLLFYYILLRDSVGLGSRLEKLSYYWLKKTTRGGKKYGFSLDEEGAEDALLEGEKKLFELINKIKDDDFSKLKQEKALFETCRNCKFYFICG